MTNDTSNPLAAREEMANAKLALTQARAAVVAATAAVDEAQQRVETARRNLDPVSRYSLLVGQPVRVVLASGAMPINTTLTACYPEGVLHTPQGQDAPQYLPYSSIEDMLEGW